jgi:hypothetical protein
MAGSFLSIGAAAVLLVAPRRRGTGEPRGSRTFAGPRVKGLSDGSIRVSCLVLPIVSGGAVFLLLAAIGTARARDNDYPTATRADYVIGCMAANGNTREALLKCSCAIDTIAGLMPYSHYEQAETALSLQAGGGLGGRVSLFRDPPQIKAVIQELRRAQAEANLQCR